jgi:hypothetical protein
MLVVVFLTPHQINDGQDAGGIQDADADEPGELFIAPALPHANDSPDVLPNDEENDYGDQHGQPGWELIWLHAARLPLPAPPSSAECYLPQKVAKDA